MAKETMNIREVSEYAKMDEIELWRLANKDKMPVVKERWHWKFEKAAIDEWLEEKSTTTL